MNGAEFIRKITKLGRKNSVKVWVDTQQGKGSHVALYYGNHRTTVKHSEISTPLLKSMCKQLNIDHKKL